ncbi:MAG: xanthine phosphoribosyltransferase [Candidatus Bipolaricaulota bacterium]
MEALKAWIQREGIVLGPEFLRVDGFLNHRINPEFVGLAGEGLAASYAGRGITCVLTAEAAGNVIAYEVARRLGACALYAKKGQAITMDNAVSCGLRSPTKGTQQELFLCRDYLAEGERVLVVDDFLHRGITSAALAQMVLQCGAELAGFGFVIEKCFSGGRAQLEAFGVPIVALAPITHMDPESGRVEFAE